MSILLFNFDVVAKFRELCFFIDEIIYSFVSNLFKVFDVLARTRLFSSDLVADLTNRTYIILSVVMLFALVYSFMTIIINPDKASSSDKAGFGIVKRVIIALVVLVFTPTAFEFAYGVQESVIDNNVIGRLLVGSSTEFNADSVSGDFVVSLFQGSFYLKQNASDLARLEYQDATISAKLNGDITAYEDVLDYVPGDVTYNNIISLIVGGFAAYCLVIFCFDLGVRCAKLAFFEMIVPIPALLYIIPGKEGSFKTWTREVLKTFFEVFVRVTIIFFMTYVFNIIGTAFDNGSLLGDLASTGSTVGVAVKLFIIIGLLVFALRAPKLICDILGIKSEGILSFKKRWDETKKAVATATTPVRKAVDKGLGTAIGIRYANKAKKIGEDIRGKKQTKFQSFMTTAGGVVNGFRGGYRKAGYAFDYEMSNQQWYSSADYESMTTGKRLISDLDNRMRNNVGAPSLYREKEAQIELDYNYQLAAIENRLSARKHAISNKISAINSAYDPVIKMDNDYISKIKDIEDHCNSRVQKEDSNIVIGGIKSAVWDKKSNSWKSITLSTEGNYASISAINEQLKDMEGLDPALRTKLITENTALLKQLGGKYKQAVENSGYTNGSGVWVDVGPDIDLTNKKKSLDTTIKNYGNLLGLELGVGSERAYTVIDSNSSLKDLHKKIDEIRASNAAGRKEAALSDETITYEGQTTPETLFVANVKNEEDEKLKKALSEDKAAQTMALSGYKQQEGRKHIYKRDNKNGG